MANRLVSVLALCLVMALLVQDAHALINRRTRDPRRIGLHRRALRLVSSSTSGSTTSGGLSNRIGGVVSSVERIKTNSLDALQNFGQGALTLSDLRTVGAANRQELTDAVNNAISPFSLPGSTSGGFTVRRGGTSTNTGASTFQKIKQGRR